MNASVLPCVARVMAGGDVAIIAGTIGSAPAGMSITASKLGRTPPVS